MPQNNSETNEKKNSWKSPISEIGSKKEKVNLSEYTGDDRVISSVEWLAEHDQEPPFLFSLKSRIPGLDLAVDGFRDGELYTISGFTKNGKTTLAQSLTDAFVKQQFLPLWFSYEVPTRQFLSRWPKCPFFYIPRIHQGRSLRWFIERCEESFLKHGTRVIFIDHLHYLFDMAKSKNPSIELGQIIRVLKTMAVQNGLLIFLLCHTSKNSTEQTEPTYHDLRDTSFISQESDSVILIHRMKDSNHSKLFVEFHRRTGVVRKMVELQMLPDGLLGEATQKYTEKKAWDAD